MNFLSSLSIEIKQQIFQSYLSSFPEDERRDENDFWAIFNNPNAQVLSISESQQPIGYLILWKMLDFIFIEHFEVFECFRGRSLGSKILNELIKKHSKIILETEPSTLNDIAKRRVKFYQRNHFEILDKNYIQPSYGIGKNPLNLWLMGTFTPKNIEKYIHEIYKIVYQKS